MSANEPPGAAEMGETVAPKPEVQQLLDMIVAMGAPPMNEQSVEQAREALRGIALMRGEDAEVGEVIDRSIPGPDGDIPVRIYVPVGGAGPHPALVWLHGGGWVIGDLDTAEGTCRSLCQRAGVVVVSIDYRLAPEAPFPAPFDDCIAATRWVAANGSELGIDTDRIAIGGDSAGGNLAAAVALALRGDVALRHQLLVYPATDLTLSHPSMDENAEGYLLTRASMEWFTGHYLGDVDPKDSRISPLYADSFAGAPPATVITAEYDPLRDEGEAYAAALRDAGVAVEAIRYDGQIHAFFGFVGMWPDADDANARAAAALRGALA
jgi:acetyl esterase